MSLLTPAKRAKTEILVIDSRFIANIKSTKTLDEMLAFVSEIRSEMPDASHHAYSYIINEGANQLFGFNDDGEPLGTAGRPLLAVLKNSRLTNLTVVVSRYFGGTLLGSGGLIRAYSNAVRSVLRITEMQEQIS